MDYLAQDYIFGTQAYVQAIIGIHLEHGPHTSTSRQAWCTVFRPIIRHEMRDSGPLPVLDMTKKPDHVVSIVLQDIIVLTTDLL